MKTKNLFFAVISFWAYSATAQVNSAPAANNPALKEKALKANQASQQKNKKADHADVNPTPGNIPVSQTFQLDENDPYQGRTEEFLSQITLTKLPDDFPKYDKSYGIKTYNAIVDNYYNQHKDILRDAVRNKLESQGK